MPLYKFVASNHPAIEVASSHAALHYWNDIWRSEWKLEDKAQVLKRA